MNIKSQFTKYLATSALMILLLGACSKSSINIDIINPNEESNGDSSGDNSNNDTPAKDNALITFSAVVEGRNLARSMSPMNRGLQSWLSAYPSGTTNITTGAPAAEGDYVTSSPGVLTGIRGYKMYLSNGIYDFYAVSCNATSPPPVFTNGISSPLSNGVDYLWWHAPQQDITNSQISIPVIYQHVATQVVIAVAGGENITLNKIVSATITPPKPGATMNLSTGSIASEESYTNAVAMGVTGFTLQYIMLPIKNSSPMTITLELMMNGENFSRTYTTPLALPNGNFAAGNSYLFRAIINENTVSFPSVSVKEWTEVDESGNPLYPIQD